MRSGWLIRVMTGIVLMAYLLLLSSVVIPADPWLTAETRLFSQGLNVLPVLLIFLILLALLARPSPALLISLALIASIFYLNHIKWNELNQPLLLTDFFLIGQVLNHRELLANSADAPVLWISLTTGLIGVAVLSKTEPAWLDLRARAVVGGLGLVGLGMLACGPGAG